MMFQSEKALDRMSRLVQEEGSRAVRSPRLLIAIALAMVAFAWGYVTLTRPESVIPNGYSYADLWYFVYYYSHFPYLLPLIAALPFAETLAQDREEGFIRYVTFRTTYRQYIAAKFIVNAMITALAVFLPMLLLFLFARMVAPPNLYPINLWQPTIVGRPWGFLMSLFESNPDGFIALIALLSIVMGILYSTLGMAVAFIYSNRYATWGIPLGLFLASHFISGKTHMLGSRWSPLTALYANANYIGPEPTVSSLLLHPAAVLVLVAIIMMVFGRRSHVLN